MCAFEKKNDIQSFFLKDTLSREGRGREKAELFGL